MSNRIVCHTHQTINYQYLRIRVPLIVSNIEKFFASFKNLLFSQLLSCSSTNFEKCLVHQFVCIALFHSTICFQLLDLYTYLFHRLRCIQVSAIFIQLFHLFFHFHLCLFNLYFSLTNCISL